MSDTFRELEPHELHHTLLQFMGQNLGELKQLDASLVNKNNTLTGITLQPREILKTLPVGPMPPSPQPIPQQIPHNNTLPTQTSTPVQPLQHENQVQDDPNQLLFNFVNELNSDPSILNIIKKISSNVDYRISDLNVSVKKIEDKIDKVIEICNSLQKNSSKKKEQQPA